MQGQLKRRQLLALLVLVPFLVYQGPVMAQVVSSISQSSSTISTTTLQTYSVAKTVTATANHVVQPFGKYTLTKTGTIYAANGVDNVTITLSSGFPSFSGYTANSTLQEWVSGCQKEQDQEQGANLIISYIGTACGVAPTLKISFSPLPLSSDSCDIYWVHEYYSWCGDSGFSYSSGVLTIVPPSATFDEDPMIVQNNGFQGCNSWPCTNNFGSAVTAGNVEVDFVGIETTSTATPTLTVTDTLSSTNLVQEVLSADIQQCSAGTYFWSSMYALTLPSSGSTGIEISGPSANIGYTVQYGWETSQVTLAGIVAGSGVGTGSSAATSSTSFTSTAPLALAGFLWNNCAGSTSFTAGASFAGTGMVVSPYIASQQSSTTLGSPTTFPATVGNSGTNKWSEAGIVLAGLTNSLFVLDVATTTQGMILMPTVNNAPTTILSSSTFTMTCCTTNTLTAIAAEWASYTFNGWSGATTWIQNTLDPTQTITYSSFAVSTLTSTLTASFSSATGGGSAPSSPDYTWLLLLPFILLAIVIVLRRR